MKISDAFPSQYLNAKDIPPGRSTKVVMDRVQIEDVAGNSNPADEKPVLYFAQRSRGMVLNRTNADTISAIHGEETDGWAGKSIIIYAATTQFQGRTVACLRVRAPDDAVPNVPADPEDVPF